MYKYYRTDTVYSTRDTQQVSDVLQDFVRLIQKAGWRIEQIIPTEWYCKQAFIVISYQMKEEKKDDNE